MLFNDKHNIICIIYIDNYSIHILQVSTQRFNKNIGTILISLSLILFKVYKTIIVYILCKHLSLILFKFIKQL